MEFVVKMTIKLFTVWPLELGWLGAPVFPTRNPQKQMARHNNPFEKFKGGRGKRRSSFEICLAWYFYVLVCRSMTHAFAYARACPAITIRMKPSRVQHRAVAHVTINICVMKSRDEMGLGAILARSSVRCARHSAREK